MDHTAIPDPTGFGELSAIEQIRYLQALWDRVVDSGFEIPVPESHLALAEQRLADYRNAPERAQPAFELLDRVARDPE